METKTSNIYIHNESESLLSKLMKFFLKVSGQKRGLEKALVKGIKQAPAPVPNSLIKKHNLKTEAFEGRPLWTISPKSNPSNKVIFYVHGGAHTYNIISVHWTFLTKLVTETNATVVVVDYPFAPSNTAESTYEYLEKVYRETSRTYPNKEIVFMGDSSGGGLALAFAQVVRDKKMVSPKQLILLSPWLDITMSNTDIQAVDPYDKVLSVGSLRDAGKLFAGEWDMRDPRVSPIYGDFDGLPTISMFMSTYDLFVADARKLVKMLDKESIPFNYYEYPKLVHTWMLFPFKETKTTLAQIANLLKE